MSCLLLAAVDVEEPCPGKPCPFWDEQCFLNGLRSELSVNPSLVRFLLGLREDLEPGSRALIQHAPGLH